ncbi:MAG: hypothetical protein IPG69_03035 [Flavobacteriales bacterium]|nr:hypothetical protein [Flavobacteriales bacterium]
MTIDDLVIDVDGGTYGFGVHLTNQADNNTISNCTIINPDATTSANYGGIISSSSLTTATGTGDNANNCTFSNNTILGASGTYKLRLNGTSAASPAVGNQVLNNELLNGYSYQIYMGNQADCLVQGNDISRPGITVTTTFYGVYLSGCSNTTVDGNAVHNVGGATAAYMYYVTTSDPIPGSENVFQNNIAYDLNNSSTLYGMYNTGSDNTWYFHNTILMDDQITATGATYGVYQTTAASGLQYFNNIIDISRSGTGIKRCLYFLTAGTTFSTDHNVLRMTSTGGTTNQVAFANSLGYATLADWQASNANAYDQNSSDADPIYQDPVGGNLTPLSGAINDIGDPGVVVPLDYTGAARPLGAAPDPGAFEFNPAACSQPTATASVVDNCVPPNNNFTIDVDVTGLGNGASVGITYDDGNGPVSDGPFGLGIHSIGPFPSGSTVMVSVTHATDALCDINLGSYVSSCPPVVSTFPYCEDFESATLCVPSTCLAVLACTATALDPVLWENATDDGMAQWSVDEGGTTSTGTGPGTGASSGQSDYFPGTITGNYLYIESGVPCNGVEAIVLSPVFDISSFANPNVRAQMAYNMFGATMGTMSIDIEDPALSGTWTTLWTLSGDQGQGWFLTPTLDHVFSGTHVRYRVRGLSGSDFTSDMAFDYFCVSEGPLCTAPIASITAVTPNCLTNTMSIDVNVTSLGDATSVTVQYSANAGPYSTACNLVAPGPCSITG